MAVKVLIPNTLRALTQDQGVVNCEGSTIRELLDALEQRCPGIKARLCDEKGELRRFLKGCDTPLQDGDEVSIVPAVAGG
jgi:molybdopterin synthase sulfur carrier subunit